mmetsp:Transcript_37853/g.65265  ORF Transcript_37853/g.65265 Transcript_37853/m.65265 type:complete len:148 (+) Transcript_37853:698-1141(+)
MMVLNLCAIAMHVPLFSAMSELSACCTSFSDFVSRAAVASSRSKIFGLRTIARAIVKRCFCPPLSCIAFVFIRSGFLSMSCHSAAIFNAFSISAIVASGLPQRTFSSTVRSNMADSCCTTAICVARKDGFQSFSGFPSKSTSPFSTS